MESEKGATSLYAVTDLTAGALELNREAFQYDIRPKSTQECYNEAQTFPVLTKIC